MQIQSRVKSELTGGDPTLLNRIAWERRWECRKTSIEYADAAWKAAALGSGKRSSAARGLARRTLAWQAKWRGHFNASMEHCLAAEVVLPEDSFPEARADIYAILGVIHYSRNRLDLATCAVDRGFYLIGDKASDENRPSLIDLLITRATVQRYAGENARAGITLGRALEIAAGPELARVEHNIGRWLLADDDFTRALEHGERALELAEDHRSRVILPYIHEVIGAALVGLDRAETAGKHFRSGLDIAEADEDQRAQCQLIEQFGKMRRQLGHLDAARTLYEEGATIARDMGYALWQKNFALGLADVYERTGNLKMALDQHKIAWKLQKETR